MKPPTSSHHGLPPSERRRTDQYGRAAFFISLVAIVISGAFALTTLVNRSDYVKLKEARRVGVAATCPLIVAVIDAGGNAISGGPNAGLLPGDRLVRGRFMPGPLTELLGPTFPGYQARKRLSRRAAEHYRAEIADTLAANLRAAGVDNPPLTGNDVSCKKYAVVVKAR